MANHTLQADKHSCVGPGVTWICSCQDNSYLPLPSDRPRRPGRSEDCGENEDPKNAHYYHDSLREAFFDFCFSFIVRRRRASAFSSSFTRSFCASLVSPRMRLRPASAMVAYSFSRQRARFFGALRESWDEMRIEGAWKYGCALIRLSSYNGWKAWGRGARADEGG